MQRSPRHDLTPKAAAVSAFWPALVLYFALCSSSVERTISRDVSTPDAFAQSALNTILGDVQQEIAAGSNATYYTAANGALLASVYQPVNPTTAVPALALQGQPATVSTFAANLLKRSAYQQNFFPANGQAGAANYNNGNTAATVVEPTSPGATPSPYTAPFYPPSNRAASVSSTVSSQNGLAVLPARWNKALLLPKASGNLTDPANVTPDSTRFVAPDWILVARNGENPTFWSPSLQTSATNLSSVVGRYAYTIYDEGGLLDLNSAGHASGTSARQVSYKDSLASADLTQAALTQDQVDSVVNWRNSHAFAGRQDLVSFFTQTLATTDATRAALQNSLQYFGVFSRGLNQPSYAPVSRVGSATNQNPRPLIQPSVATGGQPGGGNNVGDSYTTATQQDVLSPSLLSVRATAAFVRNDGTTTAALGEPLLKSRFALQRLAWLTYKGPSASNLGDANVAALTYTYGIPASYLQKGDAVTISKYFGLTWDATNHFWKYNMHNRGGTTGAIRNLQEIVDQREPDFFELLKASVDPGALGKASTNGPGAQPGDTSGVAPLNFDFKRDISLDASIIQLGANIIDQYDLDGYPTRILYTDSSGQAREFRGVENLPYIYRIRTGALKVREANPASERPPSGSGTGLTPSLHSGTQSGFAAKPLIDTGAGVIMAVPDIWNPHDQNSSLGSPGPGQSGVIRLVANSATPDTIYASASTTGYSTFTTGGFVATAAPYGNSRINSFTSAVTPDATATRPIPYFTRGVNTDGKLSTPAQIMSGSNGGFNYPHAVSPTTSSYLTFKIPTTNTLYHEPTLLGQADPTGPSALTMVVDPSNLDITALRTTGGAAAYVPGAPNYGIKTLAGYNPLGVPGGSATTAQGYIGMVLGTYPLRWVGPGWPGSNAGTLWNYSDASLAYAGLPVSAITYSLQYQDPAGGSNWITYDEKYVDSDLSFLKSFDGQLVQPGGGNYTFVDPRTPRFGSPTENNIADAAHYRAPLTAAPPTSWASTWLDTTSKLLSVVTERPDISSGFGSNFWGASSYPNDWGSYTVPGFHTQNIGLAGGPNSIFFQTGQFAQNNPFFASDGFRFSGDTGIGTRDANFWSDPDGVVRRATGAYVTSGSAVGQPLATSTSFDNGQGYATAQSQSRPMILNRPFRSVAELGYVFSGNPWKNVDFSTPESAYSELLDVFCVNEPDPATSLVAGKVNLNTRQPMVLKSILAGAYTDEENNFTSSPAWSTAPLAAEDAQSIANLLVARTSAAPPAGTFYAMSGPQPLQNVADLVGRWKSKQTISGSFTPSLGSVHNVDGSKSYDGLSADLSTLTSLTAPQVLKIPRLRESAARALSNVGNTRVWTLMIDVIAQTGEYATSATSLDQFTVEGSQRYWLHVAIDRLTGDVLDQSLEPVAEVPPTDVTLTNNSVAENQAAGTIIGTLSGVESSPASTLSYALVSGAGSDDNASFAISNNTLQTAVSLQYLNKSVYHVRVRVIDQDNLSFEKTLAVAVVPSAYTQWKIANFADKANDPMTAGDLVDADHDGTVNLLEYALGTSPLTGDTPGISTQRDANGIKFNYTRLTAATDVAAHVYWTSDLTQPDGWKMAGITETMLSDDGTIQHWQATLPLDSNQNAFLRLQVTRP